MDLSADGGTANFAGDPCGEIPCHGVGGLGEYRPTRGEGCAHAASLERNGRFRYPAPHTALDGYEGVGNKPSLVSFVHLLSHATLVF